MGDLGTLCNSSSLTHASGTEGGCWQEDRCEAADVATDRPDSGGIIEHLDTGSVLYEP